MKYIGMPMGMWVLFKKSFEWNLITEFGLDRNTAKTVAVKAKLRDKERPGVKSHGAAMKPALPPATADTKRSRGKCK